MQNNSHKHCKLHWINIETRNSLDDIYNLRGVSVWSPPSCSPLPFESQSLLRRCLAALQFLTQWHWQPSAEQQWEVAGHATHSPLVSPNMPQAECVQHSKSLQPIHSDKYYHTTSQVLETFLIPLCSFCASSPWCVCAPLECSQCAQSRACISTGSLGTRGTAVKTERGRESIYVLSMWRIYRWW